MKNKPNHAPRALPHAHRTLDPSSIMDALKRFVNSQTRAMKDPKGNLDFLLHQSQKSPSS